MPHQVRAYHHGDLRPALIEAGLAMARHGGTESILLREATRQAGVTARSAYRHFADRQALVQAVGRASLGRMADAIERKQAGLADGLGLLHAVGAGYIEFALNEPGWFEVALFGMSDMAGATPGSHQQRSPYQQLQEALRVIVVEGHLASMDAGDAAMMCWSGVHGFATLVTRGPMRQLPRPEVDELADRLLAGLVQAVVRQ